MSRNEKRVFDLCKQQEWKCYFCGLPMRRSVRTRLAATLDHLEPKNGKPRKCVAAHRICNNVRAHTLACFLDVREQVKDMMYSRHHIAGFRAEEHKSNMYEPHYF